MLWWMMSSDLILLILRSGTIFFLRHLGFVKNNVDVIACGCVNGEVKTGRQGDGWLCIYMRDLVPPFGPSYLTIHLKSFVSVAFGISSQPIPRSSDIGMHLLFAQPHLAQAKTTVCRLAIV